MRKKMKRLLGLVLSLALVMGLMPGMSLVAYAEDYPLWVGGEQVTSEKLSGDGWSYNTDTNTLTLSGYNNNGQVKVTQANTGGICYEPPSTGASPLTIELTEGTTNTLTATTDKGNGIYVTGVELTITGNGTLSITSEQGIAINDAWGVTISGGTINAESKNYEGIAAGSKLTVSGGKVTATGSKDNPSYSGVYASEHSGSISVSGGELSANGYTAIKSCDITISGGTVTATGSADGIAGNTDITINNGNITAEGKDGYGIRTTDGIVRINGGAVVASGTGSAVFGNVTNAIVGMGWMNTEGTEGKTDIAVKTTERALGYKKVQFPPAAASVTTAPTAKTLTYTGSAQELVTAGTASGGTMNYALGTDDKTAPTEGWSSSIPTGKDAGTYYVWYKAVGDATHSDTEAACVTVTITDVPKTNSLYRIYNPNSGEHFFTTSAAEKNNLVKVGWRYEGVAWSAPKSGTPVLRLYNPNAGDHHYTTSTAEKNNLVKVGWRYEGVAFYSGGSKPIYRAYNPNAVSGAHHFTISLKEKNNIVKAGWRYEGVGFYTN